MKTLLTLAVIALAIPTTSYAAKDAPGCKPGTVLMKTERVYTNGQTSLRYTSRLADATQGARNRSIKMRVAQNKKIVKKERKIADIIVTWHNCHAKKYDQATTIVKTNSRTR